MYMNIFIHLYIYRYECKHIHISNTLGQKTQRTPIFSTSRVFMVASSKNIISENATPARCPWRLFVADRLHIVCRQDF